MFTFLSILGRIFVWLFEYFKGHESTEQSQLIQPKVEWKEGSPFVVGDKELKKQMLSYDLPEKVSFFFEFSLIILDG
jgi:hypothetical protein